jgi:putative ABC transport system permease protein
MLETWVQDVRFAARLLRKSPLFTVTATLSLAIGIGANTTIFSLANALLMRPLPEIADPSRVVDLGRTTNGQGFDTVSYHYYRSVRERTSTLSNLYAYREPTPMSLGGRAFAERIYGTMVSGSYFPTLGTRAVVGRLLNELDDVTMGAHPVAVISYELWERRFEANPGIEGQAITLNGHSFAVVGVVPRGFQGTNLLEPDVWVPLAMLTQAAPRMPARMLTERRIEWLMMGGRLKDGVTILQAQSEMQAIATALEREFRDSYEGRGIAVARWAVVPGRIGWVAGFLTLLMAIVGLVMLIACVNIAGMMLARAVVRRREIAVRLAMGAGRGRLVRQLLTESLIVFAAGGIPGLILTRWLTSRLLALLPSLPVPISLDVPTDWRVLGFSIVLCLAAAILSGLAPALQASRTNLTPALKVDGLESGPSRLRLRNAFVVGQITMSLLLVIVAGLFLRSLQHAANIEPGFDQQLVDVIALDLSVANLDEKSGSSFLRTVLERLRALPGVESASAATDLPLDGGTMGLGALRLPGSTRPDGSNEISADWNVVEPGFFHALKIPMVRGRDFDERDSGTAPPVAIVSEAFARRAWSDRDPLGQRLTQENPSGKNELTVVGVAADARLVSLGSAPEPFIYVPHAQQFMSQMWLVVRNRGPVSTLPQVRAIVADVNRNLPVMEALPLRDVTAIGLAPQRVAAAVAGTLGVVGLLLAAIGIYGVTAYAVSRRTREIGIRIALGADQSRVLTLVLRQGLMLAAIGVAIGVALAGAGSSLLESLLFGVRGLDPVTFAAACLLFALVSLSASYFPARRAARVDPIVALRSE